LTDAEDISTTQELCARFERGVERLNSDADLVWRGRQLTADFVVQIGDVVFLLRVERGRVLECRRNLPLLCSWTFAIRGSARAWSALWQDPPPPGWHDIFALTKRGEMSLEYRHEMLWQYMQGGPGVFKGDLHFYRVDSDLRGKLDRIDTAACPLYLLTGEYDFSCTPEDTRRTAAAIPGAKVTIMKDVGHFPMSENPARFRKYLLPVLDEIQSAEAARDRARAK
jgi:pimeloyl-ACP methyl ester carboxylesterase